jgi:hypothetical protein
MRILKSTNIATEGDAEDIFFKESEISLQQSYQSEVLV